MRDFEQDRKICEAATPGEWRIGKYGQCVIADSEYGTHTDKGAAEYYGGNLVCESTYPQNATFIAAAREGWSAALDEIESLKRQLEMAAKEAAKGCCPYDVDKAFALICKEDCSDDDTRSERCWLEYWRQKSGTFQNGNNHGSISKTETVGEGEKWL